MSKRRLARAFDLLQLGEHETGVCYRIDTDVIATAVSCASFEPNLYPDESAMRGTDGKPRRLGDDGGVGPDSGFQKLAHPDAIVLLVDDGGNEHLAVGDPVGRQRRS